VGLQGFALFDQFYKRGHNPKAMGLIGSAGDITRLSYRLKLARGFKTLDVDGFTPKSILGYNAFFQVFLTHSAVEQYLKITGQYQRLTQQKPTDLEVQFPSLISREVVSAFFAYDRENRLFQFLCTKLDSKNLKAGLVECHTGRCASVWPLSASIRHIFAHGHLTANAKGINPSHIHKGCQALSEFLLDYVDHDFSGRMDSYARRQGQRNEHSAGPAYSASGLAALDH
jgi:hypothetical protein